MSISDLIVVMKDGVVQQIGKPQQVYDQPDNLFVAKFLGTPPINIFDGKLQGGKLYLGEDPVMDVALPDGEVTVGIRPEGFIPHQNGALRCRLDTVQVMGRDVTIVCSHPACHASVRAIVDAEHAACTEEVAFRLKENKVFLFDRLTGKRL